MNSVFILFLAWSAVAEEPRDCSLKAVKDVCAQHGKRQPGALNPWAEEGRPVESVNDDFEALESGQGSLVSEEDLLAMDYGGFEKSQIEFQDAGLKAQAETLSSLSLGTSMFKLAVSSPNTMIFVGNFIEDSAEGFSPATVTLPWPPNSKNQKTQVVSIPDFRKEFWNKLSEKERAQYKKHADHLTGLSRKMAETGGYGLLGAAKEQPRLTPQMIKDSEVERQKGIQNKRVRELMDLAKKYLIEEIRQRTPNDNNVDILIKKIETVKFSGIQAGYAQCKVDSFNAAYSSYSHELSVCSGYSQASDLNLIHTLAHELGHAIDPCNCTGSHLTFKKDVDEITGILKDVDQSSYSSGELLDMIVAATSEDKMVYGANHEITQEMIDLFEKNGIAEVTVRGIEGTYPFESTYQCLESRHQFGSAKQYSQTLAAKRAKRSPRGKKGLPPIYVNPQFKECVATRSGNSEMGEVMADVFAAKVAGRYALDHSKGDLADLFDLSSVQLAEICKNEEDLLSIHPYFKERYEKILIAEPLIQKAFNCKPTPDTQCMNKFGHLPQQINPGKSVRLPGKTEKGIQ